MKKRTKLIVTLAIVLTFLAGGTLCAQPAGKQMVFKFNCMFPSGHPRAEAWKEFCDKVLKATNGQILFQLAYSESLVKVMQEYEAVKAGAIDISGCPLGYLSGYEPWGRFDGIPGFDKDFIDAGEIAKKTSHIMDRELGKSGIKYLWAHPGSFSNFCSNKNFIKTIDDFKGTRCRTGGGVIAAAYRLWGGAGVTMPSPEMYTALQRGLVDSTFIGPDSYLSFKLWEVAPYITIFEYTLGMHVLKMNMNSWNKIPEDYQKKILDIGREMMDSTAKKLYKTYNELYEPIRGHGVKIYKPSPDLLENMKNAIKPLWKDYIKDAGNPGKEIYKILFPGQDPEDLDRK